MSSFTKPLVTEYVVNGLRKTYRDFEYHVGEEDSGEVIHVPSGFLTDFASVPWPASMLIPKDGNYNQAAVLHDFLYSTLGLNGRYTRAKCDQIFLEAMQVLGVPLWKRRIMYRAVRIGGWLPWPAKKKG